MSYLLGRINAENIPKFVEEKECTWLYSEEGDQVIFCDYRDFYLHIEILPRSYPGLGIYWIDKKSDCSPETIVKEHYSDYSARVDSLNLV